MENSEKSGYFVIVDLKLVYDLEGFYTCVGVHDEGVREKLKEDYAEFVKPVINSRRFGKFSNN